MALITTIQAITSRRFYIIKFDRFTVNRICSNLIEIIIMGIIVEKKNYFPPSSLWVWRHSFPRTICSIWLTSFIHTLLYWYFFFLPLCLESFIIEKNVILYSWNNSRVMNRTTMLIKRRMKCSEKFRSPFSTSSVKLIENNVANNKIHFS